MEKMTLKQMAHALVVVVVPTSTSHNNKFRRRETVVRTRIEREKKSNKHTPKNTRSATPFMMLITVANSMNDLNFRLEIIISVELSNRHDRKTLSKSVYDSI